MYNILYVDYSRSSYQIGGGQKYLISLANTIDKGEFRPIIFALSNSSVFKDADCKVVETVSNSNVLNEIDGKKVHKIFYVNNLFKVIKWIYESSRDLRKIIANNNIDIIHVNGMIPLVVMIVSLKWISIRTILHIHHLPPTFISKLLLTMLSRFADYRICPSKYVRRNALFFRNEQDIVIYNGVNESTALLNEKRENVIVMIANLLPIKGHINFLNAIIKIQDAIRKNGYEVHIWGDGPEKEKLSEFIRRNKLQDFVKIMGYSNDVYSLLSKAKIAVSTSIIPEAFCLATAEEMINGCVVIAPNYGGQTEIIDDGVNGFLINPNDVKKMANTIEKIILNYDCYHIVREKAVEKIKQYFLEKNKVHEIEGLYKGIIKNEQR